MSSNKELKELQAVWYKKLKENGFNDIEQDEDHLKAWTITRINNHLYGHHEKNENFSNELARSRLEDKTLYYRFAGQFLYEFKFQNNKERYIWELHAEGASHREIAEKLKKKGIKISRTPILDIIQRLKKEMIKRYASGNSE